MKLAMLTAIGISVAALAAAPSGAQAASFTPATTGTCTLSDVSLTIDGTGYAPIACRQPIQATPADGPTSTGFMATAFGVSLTYLAKVDGSGSATNTGAAPLNFTLTADIGGKTNEDWGVTWTENPNILPDLPLTADLVVGIFGGSNGAAYYFDDLLLTANPNSGTGTFTITFKNNGGQTPGLSHLTLAGTDFTAYDDGGTGNESIPEPMTLALFGLGLAGLGVASRRRKA